MSWVTRLAVLAGVRTKGVDGKAVGNLVDEIENTFLRAEGDDLEGATGLVIEWIA